jgi:hypothetical protein
MTKFWQGITNFQPQMSQFVSRKLSQKLAPNPNQFFIRSALRQAERSGLLA